MQHLTDCWLHNKEVFLVGDASLCRVDAVLPCKIEDGQERAVAFALTSLAQAECNYIKLKKDALAIVKRFNDYLFGHHFMTLLITNHFNTSERQVPYNSLTAGFSLDTELGFCYTEPMTTRLPTSLEQSTQMLMYTQPTSEAPVQVTIP